MIAETQALAPNQSLGEFLLELENVRQKFESIRPSRLRLLAFRDWRTDRGRKIAEIAKKYAQAGHESMALVKKERADNASTKAVEEAGLHLIKATCVVEKENRNVFRYEYDKIFRHEKKDSSVSFIFVLRSGENVIGFSETYYIPYNRLRIFPDIPKDKVKWFKGEREPNNAYSHLLRNFELHVHSEEEIKFLLSS